MLCHRQEKATAVDKAWWGSRIYWLSRYAVVNDTDFCTDACREIVGDGICRGVRDASDRVSMGQTMAHDGSMQYGLGAPEVFRDLKGIEVMERYYQGDLESRCEYGNRVDCVNQVDVGFARQPRKPGIEPDVPAPSVPWHVRNLNPNSYVVQSAALHQILLPWGNDEMYVDVLVF